MRRGGPRGRLGRAADIAARLALACAALAGEARAGDFSGRADLTYAQDDAAVASSDYLRQVYFLDYRRQFSPVISYRLSLRYQDDRGTTVGPDTRTRLRTRVLAPTGSLDYRQESFGASLSYRRNDESNLDPITGRFAPRVIERYAGMSYLKLFEDADVGLGADRLAYSSADVETTDDRLVASFRYTSESLRIVNDNRLQRFADARAQLARTSVGPRVAAAYSRKLGERYALSAQYVVDYFRTEQEVRTATAGSVATEVQPVAGLYLNDDLPIETPPMAPDPGLVDRGFDASAGVAIGPDGASFQNLGVDLGRFAALDELRIHVRSGAGAPVPFGGSVSWTAYSSQDGLRWAPIDGALSIFSVGMSAYVVSFPATTARFFKAVNFGVNTVDTVITELQTFVHEAFVPNQPLVSSAVRQGLGVVLSAKPLPQLVLGYSGQLNADAVSSDRSAARWSTDSTHAASATLGPYGPFSFGLGQGFTLARQPFGYMQRSIASTASVRYQPIERFDATVEGRRAEDRVSSVISVRTVTTGASLTTRIAPYDALQLSAIAGFNRQDIASGGTTDYLTAAGQSLLNLRRDLDLLLEASVQRTLSRTGDTSAQLAVPLIRILTYARYTGEARYHPSSQLALMARLGYSASDATSGLLQNYRASWSPFPGGAVQLAFDYSEEIDPLSGRSLRRIAASPRWIVNRHAVLELSYNVVRGTGSYPVRQQNLYMTFSLKL